MPNRLHLSLFAAVPGLALAAAGCMLSPALPESFDVAISTSERVSAPINSGPAGLAGAAWSLSRTGDPNEPAGGPPPGPYGGILSGDALARPPVGERIFLTRFDADGVMVAVAENRYFLAEFYGETVPVGGGWWATTLPGVEFRSASYGVQVEDRFGLAVVVNVRLGQAYVGRAVLYAWGRLDGDRIAGTFGYLLDFDGGLLEILGQIADQYPIEGQRVTE